MKDIVLDKQDVLEVMSKLPDKINIEEIIEALYVLAKINQGINDFENGNFLDHETLKKEMKKW